MNKELQIGTKHEMEHTDDPRMAKKIALDHLREHADYYTKLEKLFPEKGKPMAKKKLSDLEMPEKKASEMEGEDLLGDLAAEPMAEDAAGSLNEELAKASDDELVAECEARGFKVERPEAEMSEEAEMPEEFPGKGESLAGSEEKPNIA